MTVADYIKLNTDEKRFSFEVLPPLKGNGTEALFKTIDKLAVFNPAFINITTHHSEYVYKELDNGQYERQRIRRRPGTIAIAAAIQHRYDIPVEPHVICSGQTIEQIEYELLVPFVWLLPRLLTNHADMGVFLAQPVTDVVVGTVTVIILLKLLQNYKNIQNNKV